MAGRLHALIRDVERYSLQSASQRVIGYFLQQMSDTSETPAEVTLHPSKRVVASRLGMSPATLSRAMRDLSQTGLITVRGRMVLVPDPKALVAALG